MAPDNGVADTGILRRPARPQTHTVSLRARHLVALGTMAFDLSRPPGFEFRAGQAVGLTLKDMPRTDAKGNRRTFSIASAPQESVITVATRMRNTAFKEALAAMPLHAALALSGPTGRFYFEDGDVRPAVLIAGGIGITPFMSMLKDAASKPVTRDYWLFYSNRNRASSAYLDELSGISNEQRRVRVIPVMSEEQSDEWMGERGLIDHALLSRHGIDFERSVFYIAGPGGMVSAMQAMIADAGVSEGRMHFDEFWGY